MRGRRWTLSAVTAIGLSLATLSGPVSAASAAPSAPSTSRPSITTIPIQVIQTSDGAVSYRSDGSGPPLVMIVGFGGSQDSWEPNLVNALAKHHQVVIFDNAGVGQTAMPPGTLTISAMADQTAALIEALNLGQPAVLGWSMGGMIAQALATLHPGDLSRLVLCGTLGGDGTATPVPPARATELFNAVTTGDTNTLISLLFPPNKVATKGAAYIAAVLSYPQLYEASSAVDDAQWVAIQSWEAGTDPGGHGAITVPTLIGDGAEDQLVPLVDAHQMKEAIAGARLVIFRGAGHAFLFQDARRWSARVNRFLAP